MKTEKGDDIISKPFLHRPLYFGTKGLNSFGKALCLSYKTINNLFLSICSPTHPAPPLIDLPVSYCKNILLFSHQINNIF